MVVRPARAYNKDKNGGGEIIMKSLMDQVVLFCQGTKLRCDDQKGQTMVEYALVIGLIVVGLVVAWNLTGLTTAVNDLLTKISDAATKPK